MMLKYNLMALMYTRTCPLACEHCISDSSPQVKERMRLREAVNYLDVIAKFCSQLGFTGGEPFLYYRDVAILIAHAKSLDLRTSLVTGAGWVRDEAKARHRVEAFADAGLEGLCISWDEYHEAFAPPEGAVMLARIAVESGLQVCIRTVTSPRCTKDEYHARFAGLPVHFEEQKVVKLGRAVSLPPSYFEYVNMPPKGICQAVYSSVIEADGNVYACCGPAHFCRKPSPLYLGNARVEPLEDILERGLKDPILQVIASLGPYGLYSILKDHPLGRDRFKPRAAYTGVCELCLDIASDPEFVSAIRERLSHVDVQELVSLSRLRRQKKGPIDPIDATEAALVN
jgi:MoaA/NifB/PqqE/SkfB family radical SAM enzyme